MPHTICAILFRFLLYCGFIDSTPCICMLYIYISILFTLQWRHNERDGVSNHQRPDCLLNSLVRLRRSSNKTSRFRVTGLCEGKPHKRPVTRQMFPFHDVIMMVVQLAVVWSYYCPSVLIWLAANPPPPPPPPNPPNPPNPQPPTPGYAPGTCRLRIYEHIGLNV